MDMHAAALPPIQPAIFPKDRAHPLFAEYQHYRSAMSARLLEADSFDAWLFQRERNQRDDALEAHPRFREYQQWMRDTQGGAPGKTDLRWPANFRA